VGATGFVAGTWGESVPGFAAPVDEDEPVPGVIAADGADGFAAGAGVAGFAPMPAGGAGNAWPPPGAVGAGVPGLPGVTATAGVVGATGFVAGTWGDGVPGFAVPVGEDAPVPGAIAADGAAGGAGRGCPLIPGSGCPG
jgi:hypothetical protein